MSCVGSRPPPGAPKPLGLLMAAAGLVKNVSSGPIGRLVPTMDSKIADAAPEKRRRGTASLSAATNFPASNGTT